MRKGTRRGDGDSEPSAKRSNAKVCANARAKVRAEVRSKARAKVRTKAHTKARADVMGTLNQVQKGQMQRCTQRRAQR